MYIDTSTIRRKDKTYTRYLLRENYREAGKVKHRTIANLSACSPEEISAMKLAFAHKHDLKDLSAQLTSKKISVQVSQGLSVGAVWLLKTLAKELGIEKALGVTQSGKLALWQIIARAIDQGSRLSAVRLASQHAACDILNLESFNEESLYKNLDWLSENQKQIEERLFKLLPQEEMNLFFYDVTSSYFEGTCNELAKFGYNRDKKSGKSQIVIGLLCNKEGTPITVQVFEGNTQDPATLTVQLQEAAKRFGVKKVVWIGDRGMIKSTQITRIKEDGMHYITAITKPQIEKLCNTGIVQMDLFDAELTEITDADNQVRYILRRNPVRADEIQAARASKLARLEKLVADRNTYLAEHAKAKTETAQNKINEKLTRLKLGSWVSVNLQGRVFTIIIDDVAKLEEEKLDGCYVIKTDLINNEFTKEIIHQRYKDLAMVELAFRTSKTAHLELRPVYVRNAERTRGHVFVVMLAYRLIKELKKRWSSLEITVAEGINQLSALASTEVVVNNQHHFNQIPIPNAVTHSLLQAAKVKLPTVIPAKGIAVATRKKLASQRKPL